MPLVATNTVIQTRIRNRLISSCFSKGVCSKQTNRFPENPPRGMRFESTIVSAHTHTGVRARSQPPSGRPTPRSEWHLSVLVLKWRVRSDSNVRPSDPNSRGQLSACVRTAKCLRAGINVKPPAATRPFCLHALKRTKASEMVLSDPHRSRGNPCRQGCRRWPLRTPPPGLIVAAER